jgi:chromosome segregation ATPase
MGITHGKNKMTEKKSSKFKMSMDDERPDLQFQDEADSSQLEKLNKRITRISILIPCLLCAILLAAYFNIKTHLSKVNTTGAIGVQALSKELESKFSSLSVREATLEESMEKKVGSLEKTAAALQKNVKEASTAIRHIRSARKTDNQKTANAFGKMEKTLGSMSKKLDKISSDLKSLDQALTKKLMIFSETGKNDLAKIRSNMAELKTAMVDRNDVDSALKDQQKIYQIALGKLASNLEDKITNLEKKLKKLEKAALSPGTPKQVKSKKALSSSKVETEKKPSPLPPKDTVIPDTETIIEEDLKKKTPG